MTRLGVACLILGALALGGCAHSAPAPVTPAADGGAVLCKTTDDGNSVVPDRPVPGTVSTARS